MTTQPQQINEARRVMRGKCKDLRHNRRRDDEIIAEINREIMRERRSLPARVLAWLMTDEEELCP